MRISIIDSETGTVTNIIEATDLATAQKFYPSCRVALDTDVIAQEEMSQDALDRAAFDAEQQAAKDAEFEAWKAAGGTEKPVTELRASIRVAAEKLGILEAVDAAVLAVADKSWLVRWQEGDAFMRAELDVLQDGKVLDSAALDSIFDLAGTIVVAASFSAANVSADEAIV